MSCQLNLFQVWLAGSLTKNGLVLAAWTHLLHPEGRVVLADLLDWELLVGLSFELKSLK